MTAPRDPWICAECGVSNPWMNDTCRVCGEPRALPPSAGEEDQGGVAQAPGEEVAFAVASAGSGDGGEVVANEAPSVDEDAKAAVDGTEVVESARENVRSRAPLNIRWIVACAFILTLLAGGAEKWAESTIRSDPERAAVVDDALIKADRGQELTEAEKARVKDALLGNSWMVPLLAVMFLVFPFGIGVLVGYATGTIRDGMISVAAGMAGYFVFIANFLPVAIVAVGVYSGVGALASYLGKRLR